MRPVASTTAFTACTFELLLYASEVRDRWAGNSRGAHRTPAPKVWARVWAETDRVQKSPEKSSFYDIFWRKRSDSNSESYMNCMPEPRAGNRRAEWLGSKPCRHWLPGTEDPVHMDAHLILIGPQDKLAELLSAVE